MTSPLRMYKAFRDALDKNPYDEVTHRAFADFLDEQGIDDEAEFHRNWTKEWQDAHRFLKELAVELQMTHEEFLDAAKGIAGTGEYDFNDDDCPRIMRDNWEDFLKHWKVYRPDSVVVEMDVDDTMFTCGC